jgi:hypothetical protein
MHLRNRNKELIISIYTKQRIKHSLQILISAVALLIANCGIFSSYNKYSGTFYKDALVNIPLNKIFVLKEERIWDEFASILFGAQQGSNILSEEWYLEEYDFNGNIDFSQKVASKVASGNLGNSAGLIQSNAIDMLSCSDSSLLFSGYATISLFDIHGRYLIRTDSIIAFDAALLSDNRKSIVFSWNDDLLQLQIYKLDYIQNSFNSIGFLPCSFFKSVSRSIVPSDSIIYFLVKDTLGTYNAQIGETHFWPINADCIFHYYCNAFICYLKEGSINYYTINNDSLNFIKSISFSSQVYNVSCDSTGNKFVYLQGVSFRDGTTANQVVLYDAINNKSDTLCSDVPRIKQ